MAESGIFRKREKYAKRFLQIDGRRKLGKISAWKTP
jgi:hypothetical protein